MSPSHSLWSTHARLQRRVAVWVAVGREGPRCGIGAPPWRTARSGGTDVFIDSRRNGAPRRGSQVEHANLPALVLYKASV